MVDIGLASALLSGWIFVEQSGAKRAPRQLADPDRRQGSAEGAHRLSRGHSGPAWARCVRHEPDGGVCPHLSVAQLVGNRAKAAADARQSSGTPEVSRSRELLRASQ